MNKKMFLIILLSIISLLPFFSSCKDSNKIIEVESLEITTEKARISFNSTMQYSVKILPDNATNKDVKWYLNDYTYANVSENGLLSTYDKAGIVKLYCVSGNGIKAEKVIQVVEGRPEPFVGDIYLNNEDLLNPINDKDLLEFSKKYNDVLIYGEKMLEKIKSENSNDLEFINIISKLEESYFSKDSINQNAFIIIKRPNLHNQKFYIYNISFREDLVVVNFETNEASNNVNYFKDDEYIIFKYQLDKTNEVSELLLKRDDLLRNFVKYIDYKEILINEMGELK